MQVAHGVDKDTARALSKEARESLTGEEVSMGNGEAYGVSYHPLACFSRKGGTF